MLEKKKGKNHNKNGIDNNDDDEVAHSLDKTNDKDDDAVALEKMSAKSRALQQSLMVEVLACFMKMVERKHSMLQTMRELKDYHGSVS